MRMEVTGVILNEKSNKRLNANDAKSGFCENNYLFYIICKFWVKRLNRVGNKSVIREYTNFP